MRTVVRFSILAQEKVPDAEDSRSLPLPDARLKHQ